MACCPKQNSRKIVCRLGEKAIFLYFSFHLKPGCSVRVLVVVVVVVISKDVSIGLTSNFSWNFFFLFIYFRCFISSFIQLKQHEMLDKQGSKTYFEFFIGFLVEKTTKDKNHYPYDFLF